MVVTLLSSKIPLFILFQDYAINCGIWMSHDMCTMKTMKNAERMMAAILKSIAIVAMIYGMSHGVLPLCLNHSVQSISLRWAIPNDHDSPENRVNEASKDRFSSVLLGFACQSVISLRVMNIPSWAGKDRLSNAAWFRGIAVEASNFVQILRWSRKEFDLEFYFFPKITSWFKH